MKLVKLETEVGELKSKVAEAKKVNIIEFKKSDIKNLHSTLSQPNSL